MRPVDITGARIGHLVAIRRETVGGRSIWLCRCDCGSEKSYALGQLHPTPRVKTCGCGRSTHRQSKTREFRIWLNMLDRCRNSGCPSWPEYGGRGIRVCERWQSFENFLADMGPRPSPKHSIDRRDNGGDYAPDNCRWATFREQNNNKRTNRRIAALGKTQTLAEWARETGLTKTVISSRLQRGWSAERAVTEATR